MAWNLEASLQPVGSILSGVGTNVAVSGDTIAVAWCSALDVYTFAAGAWTGQRLASWSQVSVPGLALEGDTLALGVGEQVKVFSRTNGAWSGPQTLAPAAGPPSRFGSPLALHGPTLAVGQPGLSDNVGQVVLYDRVGGTWSAEAAVIASVPYTFPAECFADPADQDFGAALALTSYAGPAGAVDRLVVGKPGIGQTCNSSHDYRPGQAFVFERSGANQGPWTLATTLASQSPSAAARFGKSVAAAGDTVFVAGPGEVRAFRGSNGAWSTSYQDLEAGVGAALAFDGDTFAFTNGSDVDPWSYDDAQGDAWPASPVSPPDAPLALSVDGDRLAVGASASLLVYEWSFRLETSQWAFINPLAVLLGDQTFVRLTLPDPPPIEVVREQLASGVAAMSRAEQRRAVRALRATIAMLGVAARAIETGQRRDAPPPSLRTTPSR